MIISIRRFSFQDKCTVGHVLVDGTDTGLYSLEDKYREVDGQAVVAWKVPNETAIPKGRYSVVVDYSPHFGRDLPHILDVPGYTGVRIHPGNSDVDTEGCVLIGQNWAGADYIGDSRLGFGVLFNRVMAAVAVQDAITIEVG
jgi:Family of unknown function (DUF5675)